MSVTDISRVLPQFCQLSGAAALRTKSQQFSSKYLPGRSLFSPTLYSTQPKLLKAMLHK